MTATPHVGRTGVWGASGSGKSAFTKQQIAGMKRLVVFDPLAEYTLMPVIRDLDAVRAEMRANWTGFRLAYVPPVGKEPQALSALSRLMMAAQQPFKEGRSARTMTLIVEEMNLSFPVGSGVAKSPGFAELCSRGRHYGIALVGLSQRIAEVDTRFRGNCNVTVAFRQKGPRDQQAAAAEIGCAVADLPKADLQYLRAAGGEVDPMKTLKFGKKPT
ncbi:zonular occludens toxin domain-containing protein [Rhodophyticola sp.]|jgi:DNA helicase HerA-like ATPase|uniref:zonular occludens toxin domain-containing protein n=1 Tax=Rhodophyticola sp. TaxID=2680032 RepID=UPI001B099A2C|nr:ATP-binding protein [Roseicyclus sp.]MBO6626700.1 ATP-binding protein [Roseicyclus sp.]MBO6922364.1 ATP-binding protein [Roseicyclus sp.]